MDLQRTSTNHLKKRFRKPFEPIVAPQVAIITEGLLEHVRLVIRETTTPTWLGSVPYDFGEKKAGKLKANEWRLMCTIYLPLALVSWWGEGSSHGNELHSRHSRQVLDHTMELVSAVVIACQRSTDEQMSLTYKEHIHNYSKSLREVYPNANITTNLHMATHIHRFMKAFGPTCAWWCFSYERLIGFFQKIPNNGQFGRLILLIGLPVLTLVGYRTVRDIHS